MAEGDVYFTGTTTALKAADPRRAFLFTGETDSPDWPAGSRPGNAGLAAKLVLPLWVTAGR
jgi:hypothetical protein